MMTKEEIIKNISEILEQDNILSDDTDLSTIEEWDSLTFVSILVFFKKNLNVSIDATNFKDCKTLKDVLALANIS